MSWCAPGTFSGRDASGPGYLMHSIVFLDRATLAPDDRLRCPSFAHRWTEYERAGPPAADSTSTRLGPT